MRYEVEIKRDGKVVTRVIDERTGEVMKVGRSHVDLSYSLRDLGPSLTIHVRGPFIKMHDETVVHIYHEETVDGEEPKRDGPGTEGRTDGDHPTTAGDE